MSPALLAIQNILQNSYIFNRSLEIVIFTPFGDKKVTQFSGFLNTSVSYLKDVADGQLTKILCSATIREHDSAVDSCE